MIWYACRRHHWRDHVVSFLTCVTISFIVYTAYFALLHRRHQTSLHGDLPREFPEVADDTQGMDVTVITAYFDIGSFRKGLLSTYKPDNYRQWMKVFSRISNPLILFTDSKDVFDRMKTLRSKLLGNHTRCFMVNRTDLWSFSISREIREIFNQPGYPKYYPLTVNENYSSVMHAKYELMNKAIRQRLVTTKFVCWLDIGLFRAITDRGPIFPIQIPPNWDSRTIAYTSVFDQDTTLTPEDVFYKDLVWISGAIFIGKPEVMSDFTADYLRAVKILLKRRLMGSDQQVIFSMYLPSFELKPRVHIQTYLTHRYRDYYYLGYLIRDLWTRQVRYQLPLQWHQLKQM